MKKRNFGDNVIEGMQEVLKDLQGKSKLRTHTFEIPDNIDIKAIRNELNFTRNEFAQAFGFSAKTLQHWEQGLRKPTGPARVLLTLLQKDPIFVSRTILAEGNAEQKIIANFKHMQEKINSVFKLVSDAEIELKKKNLTGAALDISNAKKEIKKLTASMLVAA